MMKNMLIILRFIENFEIMQFLVYMSIFAIIMSIIDISVIMKALRITSKNHARLKLCAIDIFLSMFLINIF